MNANLIFCFAGLFMDVRRPGNDNFQICVFDITYIHNDTWDNSPSKLESSLTCFKKIQLWLQFNLRSLPQHQLTPSLQQGTIQARKDRLHLNPQISPFFFILETPSIPSIPFTAADSVYSVPGNDRNLFSPSTLYLFDFTLLGFTLHRAPAPARRAVDMWKYGAPRHLGMGTRSFCSLNYVPPGGGGQEEIG